MFVSLCVIYCIFHSWIYFYKKHNLSKILYGEGLPQIIAQKKYKIESTPTIMINEKKYSGTIIYKDFKKVIEKVDIIIAVIVTI